MVLSPEQLLAALRRFRRGEGIFLINGQCDDAGPVVYDDDGWAAAAVRRFLNYPTRSDFQGLGTAQAYAAGLNTLQLPSNASSDLTLPPFNPFPNAFYELEAPLIAITWNNLPAIESASVATLNTDASAGTYTGLLPQPASTRVRLRVIGFDRSGCPLNRTLSLRLFTERAGDPTTLILFGLPQMAAGIGPPILTPPDVRPKGQVPVICGPAGNAYADKSAPATPITGLTQTAWGRQLKVSCVYQNAVSGLTTATPLPYVVTIVRPGGLGNADTMCKPSPCLSVALEDAGAGMAGDPVSVGGGGNVLGMAGGATDPLLSGEASDGSTPRSAAPVNRKVH